jgi:serine/threonine-protein phosphatase 5
MASTTEQAVAFKNDGNKAFASHDWQAAVNLYTKAIELNDKEPTFFTNRAQAHIKSEAFGYAIADATKAIELNPKFVKVRLGPSSPR